VACFSIACSRPDRRLTPQPARQRARSAQRGRFCACTDANKLSQWTRRDDSTPSIRANAPAQLSPPVGAGAPFHQAVGNLHRAELTVGERTDQIAEWVRLTAEKVSVQVEHKPQGGRPESVVAKASRDLGIDRQSALFRIAAATRARPSNCLAQAARGGRLAPARRHDTGGARSLSWASHGHLARDAKFFRSARDFCCG
jgi:hypothetical protein